MNKIVCETVLEFYPEVEAIYLFGSYGKGEEWPDSDVDLALLLPVGIARDAGVLMLSPCRQELGDRLHKEIDLINLRMVSTVLQNEVLNASQRLLTNEEETILAFEMQALSDYLKLNEERAGILKSFRKTKRAYAI
jgi:predicted nucleotidyltransferase